jgi:hypothetical protein
MSGISEQDAPSANNAVADPNLVDWDRSDNLVNHFAIGLRRSR